MFVRESGDRAVYGTSGSFRHQRWQMDSGNTEVKLVNYQRMTVHRNDDDNAKGLER
jgi:hypothetical protein